MTWRECRLGDVMRLQRGHDLPSQDREDGEVPVVSSSGITGFHSREKAPAPGVVTGRYGTLGEVFFLDRAYWPLNTALYVTDFKGNDPKFTAYFLRNALKDYQSDKAAVPGIDRNVLHELKVRVPELPQQRRIVHLLVSYDDLIDNNRRRIKLLEDSVRLLFDEWFVRLRPPGHSGLFRHGTLPAGWRWGKCTDVVTVNPKVRTAKDAALWYVPMSALSQIGMTVDRADFERRVEHTAVRFERGDTLFARITPCLENGKTGYVYFLDKGEIACGSTEFVVLRGRQVSSYFTYCLARLQTFRDAAVKSMVGSSGRQRVQPSAFEKFELAIPAESALSKFDEVAADCFEQVANLAGQNERLTRARDLLLPRLMSGELTV
jgi:type I restriction enzyme S subunit